MRIFVFICAMILGWFGSENSAFAQGGPKCKDLSTVAACVSCSVKKGGLQKFSQAGIEQWCQQQVGKRKAKS